MTERSEGQPDQVRLKPCRPRLGAEHRIPAPVLQRSVLIEQQRVGREELFEVQDLGPVGHRVRDQPARRRWSRCLNSVLGKLTLKKARRNSSLGVMARRASSEKEMTPPARFAGSGACLAAGARSLARFLRGH
jgi:hypothetical protein